MNCENHGHIWKAVEFAQKPGVMKADPSAAAFFDVLDEGGLRGWRPDDKAGS